MPRQFTDLSRAPRIEKAKRVLASLSNPHDYRYFHGDGLPRHAEIQQDAAAALEVLEELLAAQQLAVELNEAMHKEAEYRAKCEGASLEFYVNMVLDQYFATEARPRAETPLNIPAFLRSTQNLIDEIAELRAKNVSDREIAIAVGIPEDSPLLVK